MLGNGRAINNLGLLMESGFDTPDFELAKTYYNKGIELKVGSSFNNLGMMYLVVENNPEKAM